VAIILIAIFEIILVIEDSLPEAVGVLDKKRKGFMFHSARGNP
jgi:hypothetical protein